MLEASPSWQNAFLVVVFVAAGWCVWSGWRLGVVRALFSLLGMLAAGVAAVLVATFVGGIAVAITPFYGALIGLLAGTFAALVGYAFVSFIGALLFKRTAQQPTATLRFVYGMGGALIGIFVGISVAWGALFFARGMGALCLGTVDNKNGINPLPLPLSTARAFVKLKRSVEAGSTGKFLKSVDTFPEVYYRVIEKLGRLIVDPDAVRKFVTYPGIQGVLADMHVIELTKDPEVQELVRTQNSAALLKNKKMIDAMKNPGFIAKLQKIDFEKALDYALSKPKPGGTPPATSHQSYP